MSYPVPLILDESLLTKGKPSKLENGKTLEKDIGFNFYVDYEETAAQPAVATSHSFTLVKLNESLSQHGGGREFSQRGQKA